MTIEASALAAELAGRLGLENQAAIAPRIESLLGRRFTLRINAAQSVTMRVMRIDKGMAYCTLEDFRPKHQAVPVAKFLATLDAGTLEEVIAPEYRVLGPLDPRD